MIAGMKWEFVGKHRERERERSTQTKKIAWKLVDEILSHRPFGVSKCQKKRRIEMMWLRSSCEGNVLIVAGRHTLTQKKQQLKLLLGKIIARLCRQVNSDVRALCGTVPAVAPESSIQKKIVNGKIHLVFSKA